MYGKSPSILGDGIYNTPKTHCFHIRQSCLPTFRFPGQKLDDMWIEDTHTQEFKKKQARMTLNKESFL
jgi:hypothetical protein